MATTYTPEQIRQFIQQKGLINDPNALYKTAQEYGVDPSQIDQAQGWDAGTSQSWLGSAGRDAANWQDPGYFDQWARQGMSSPDYSAGTAPAATMPTTTPRQPPTMPGAGGPPSSQPNPGANPLQPGGTPPAGGGAPWGGAPGPLSWGNSTPWAGANPATDAIAGSITGQVNRNLQRNVLPGIRDGAMAAGGIGGSRQGVAEGIAIGDSMTGLSGALANLYGTQFNTDRSHELQSDALDLNVYDTNQKWMRTGQQDQLALLDQMLGWQGQGVKAATDAQNTPLDYWSKFTDAATKFGGQGGTSSQQLQGNPFMGGVGGALLLNQLFGGGG